MILLNNYLKFNNNFNIDIKNILSLVNYLNIYIHYNFIIFLNENDPDNNVDMNIVNNRIHFENYQIYMSFDPNENYNIQQQITKITLLNDKFLYMEICLDMTIFNLTDKYTLLNLIKNNIDKIQVLIYKNIIISKNYFNKIKMFSNSESDTKYKSHRKSNYINNHIDNHINNINNLDNTVKSQKKNTFIKSNNNSNDTIVNNIKHYLSKMIYNNNIQSNKIIIKKLSVIITTLIFLYNKFKKKLYNI